MTRCLRRHVKNARRSDERSLRRCAHAIARRERGDRAEGWFLFGRRQLELDSRRIGADARRTWPGLLRLPIVIDIDILKQSAERILVIEGVPDRPAARLRTSGSARPTRWKWRSSVRCQGGLRPPGRGQPRRCPARAAYVVPDDRRIVLRNLDRVRWWHAYRTCCPGERDGEDIFFTAEANNRA